MKKMILSVMVALMAVTTSFAQNTLVAVLSHGTDVQTFYGATAYANAVLAAESGDVISLSAGTFNIINITKGITIRGAGATSLSDGSFSISVPEDDVNPLIIEGVNIGTGNYGNLSKLTFMGKNQNYTFIKCRITHNIYFDSSASVLAKYVNCDITGSFYHTGTSSLKFTNCIVSSFSKDATTTSKADFINCVVRSSSAGYDYSVTRYNYLYSCYIVNTIIYNGGGKYIPNDLSAMNCLFVNCDTGGQRIDCYSASNTSAVFATTTGDIPYSLTDEAKTTYIGTDGTEIGIYGGQYPYSLTPTYPLITKLNVAKQATADNKLSVEIEVTAAE